MTLLVFAAGCSGAEESDLFGPSTDGAGAGAASDAPATSSDATTPSPSTSTGSDPAPADPAPPPSNDDPGASDPTEPAPACAAESLDNDEFKTADPFDACIAGELVDRDVDFVSTVAPATAKQITIKHGESGGKVAYRVFVNGFSTTFTDDPPSEIPAVPNAKYTFKIERAGFSGGDRSWQLEVTFQ